MTTHTTSSLSLSANRDDFSRARRLATVSALGALDRIGDPVLVSLTRLAQSVTGASAAAVHIFDELYQRRVAATGAPLGEHPAADSMCRLVVEDGVPFVCADAVTEPRFSYSSFVAGSTPVRFYASVPIKISGDVTVGTLCAFDTVPRATTKEQIERLQDLAGLTSAHLSLVQLATALGREASVDGLTGVSTRLLFDDQVAQALAHRRRSGADMLVALIDLDDFKSINDTHGHARGDDALCWVAAKLAELIGTRGSVGRMGGDEFATVSDHTGAEAEQLIGAIGAIGRTFDPPFGISVGATYADANDDVPALMRRADQRMYAEKATGHRLPHRATRALSRLD